MEKSYSYFLSAIVAGLLYSLIQPPFYFSIIAFIGLIPLFYIINNQRNIWDSALVGMLFGLGYFAVTMRWLWAAYPLDNLGIHSRLVSFEVLLCVWLITIIGLAIPWTLLGIGMWRIKVINSKPLLCCFGIAALYTLISYLDAYAINITWLNIQAGIGPHFTYGNIAYAFAHSQIARHIASYIGIYGVTFCVALINALIFCYYPKKSKRILGIIGIAIIIFYIPLSNYTSKNPVIHFGLIQTNIPTSIDPKPSETLVFFKQQLTQLNTLAKEHPETEIIVFPETSNFFYNLHLFLTSGQAKQYFNQLFNHPTLIVAGGKTINNQGTTYSRSFLLDTKKDIIGYHDKQILTPMGEYLPFYITAPLKFITPDIYNTYIRNRQFSPGTIAQDTFVIENNLRVSPFICSELLSPSYVRTHLNDSHIIIAQTSTGIFRGNTTILSQNLAQAQFRAAENSTPILLSANDGESYAIDSDGITTNKTKNHQWQILTGTLETGKNDSWYTKVGDFPIIFACLSILFIIILHLRRHEH